MQREREMSITWVYYDLETTGLLTSSEIVEIAASTLDGSSTFSSLVRVDHIPSDATRVNGITQDDVKDKPRWSTIGALFFDWLALLPSAVCVAHNGTRYDEPILRRQCKEHGVVVPPALRFADSWVAFKETFPFPRRSFGLASLAKLWVKDGTQQEHRASSDVDMMLLVRKHCPCPQDFDAALLAQL